ncbi:DNA repair protein RadA-like isoform X8 [Ricinus communis]|uniref:DNA repair protein RadA-like isoform X8 n=1 Tax=Ricinus communis TaxID=3988 RepID=UPI00201AF287|nr:DNA repair protein RadA-like isoform X8 [Ricinus communis]
MVRSWLPQKVSETQPLRLKDVNQRMNQPGLFGSEVARVLGGGVVPGSLILIGSDPGVGKSTLLLQVAAIIAEGQDVGKRDPVVYVSGEESVEQIVNRADRLSIGVEELFLYSSTDIEVNECTSALLRFAKKTNIPVLLVGHVTKSGDIAGPRVLEHIVDVVLYLEAHLLLVVDHFFSSEDVCYFMICFDQFHQGEKHSTHRLLCPVKNRFGCTDEVLKKQAGLMLQDNDIFLNVVSGVTLTETAGDLAIAAAICSSFLEFPIPNNVAFIGEIGLGGELCTLIICVILIHNT